VNFLAVKQSWILINVLKDCRGLIVNENAAKAICHSAIEVLAEEPQVLKITPQVAVAMW